MGLVFGWFISIIRFRICRSQKFVGIICFEFHFYHCGDLKGVARQLFILHFFPQFYQSNPSLSRITTCCQGYQRDAHIVRKCNPVCSTECINGICFAPNECICYPDHVKNFAGFCVPTCPNGEIEIPNYW